jgi:hypothetical protein
MHCPRDSLPCIEEILVLKEKKEDLSYRMKSYNEVILQDDLRKNDMLLSLNMYTYIFAECIVCNSCLDPLVKLFTRQLW